MDKETKLLELAKKRFGRIGKAEEKLFRSAAKGELADYSDRLEENNDPHRAEEWGKRRVIRAECIAWLCTDRETSAMVTHKGVFVKGARIEGELDLQFARILFPLSFKRSALPRVINLQYAKIRNLFLIGTHTGPIYGDGAKVDGSVSLRNCFKAEGEVRLCGATIGGQLNCSNGEFINAEGHAINADALKVNRDVFLRNGFKAEGEVRLRGATIGGQLSCIDGEFINAEGRAINADALKVNRDVLLRSGFKAEGEVCLRGATIGGQLNCSNGEFINTEGRAINADALKVDGSVFLCNGFKAEGIVDLTAAEIGGILQWHSIKLPEKATLDVRSTSVGTLWDDVNSWPDEGKLFLHGFIYKEISDLAPRDAKSRIQWLRQQPSFVPQPYEQLAEVLRKSGQDRDVRKVLIAKNKDKSRLASMGLLEKSWHSFLGWTIGYGYRPQQGLLWILLFIIAGSILLGYGKSEGLITATKEMEYVSRGGSKESSKGYGVSEDYPEFQAVIYSIDAFVPLVDLHQCKYWLPNLNKGEIWFKWKGYTVLEGGLILAYMWIHIVAGWILTALFFVGLTGLVRR